MERIEYPAPGPGGEVTVKGSREIAKEKKEKKDKDKDNGDDK